MEEFLKKYNTSEEGLSSNEVTKRQNQNGLNELKEKKKKPITQERKYLPKSAEKLRLRFVREAPILRATQN